MLTASDGTRFLLAPWRMRRLLSRLREARSVQRGPGQATPAVLLQDLREIVRHARPVGRATPLGGPSRARIYEASSLLGRFRLLTAPGPGYDTLVNLFPFAHDGTEGEVARGGVARLSWIIDTPQPIARAIGALMPGASRGIYILYRGSLPLYVGMTDGPLAERLRDHLALINRYGSSNGIGVSVAQVAGGPHSVRCAEHALVRTLLKLGYELTNVPLRAPFRVAPIPLTVSPLLPPTQSDRLLLRRDRVWTKRGGTRRDWEALRAGNRLKLLPGETYELGT